MHLICVIRENVGKAMKRKMIFTNWLVIGPNIILDDLETLGFVPHEQTDTWTG